MSLRNELYPCALSGEVAWTEREVCWTQDHGGAATRDPLRQIAEMHMRARHWLVVQMHGGEAGYRLLEGEFMTNARNKALEGPVAERTRLLDQEKKRS